MKKSLAFLVFFTLLVSLNLSAQTIAEGISASGILDSQYPGVEVIFPNGGEVFQVGDQVNVQWTAADSSFGGTPVSIYYSVDNGLTFTEIVSNITNESPRVWEVPNMATLEGLVRIVAVDSFGLVGADTSDAVFKIDGPPVQPTGLLASLADHVINLSWNAVDEGDMDRYRIYRSMSAETEVNSENLIDSVAVPTIVYADSNVVHGETYYYVITAVDSLGNESIASLEVSGTAYILQITSVSFVQRKDGSKQVDISYSFVGNPVGTYTITPYYSIDEGTSWVECSMIIGGNSGAGLEPGSYSILWDFGSELAGAYRKNALIKITGTEN